MNPAKPSRVGVLFSLALLLAVSVAMWVRSYRTYDLFKLGRAAVCSESGSLYAYRSFEVLSFHESDTAGTNGRLEEETGSAYRPWLPAWTWIHVGDRFVTVQWWAVSLAEAGALWWCWRSRGRDGRGRGFAVVTT